MKININLHYNNAYKWYNKNDIYVIGYAIKDDSVIKEEQLVDYFSGGELDEITEKAKNLQGYFSVVKIYSGKVYIIADRIRSFPVFYTINGNELFVFDNIYDYKELELDEKAIKEIKSLGYVTGNKTLHKNIYQLENSQIVVISEKEITKIKYFEYIHEIQKMTDEDVIKKLDSIYNNSIKRLIKYLNGRRAVVPLSGGHDSRLIAYYLKLNGYNNIIAYTYGAKNNAEAEISKKVAEVLDIPWFFVEYKPKNMRNKYKDKKSYSEMADYYGRGYSVPLIQEWEAIEELLNKKIINKEDVVVPGYTGDFIAGNHLVSKEVSKNKAEEVILNKHYVFSRKFNKNLLLSIINEKLDSWKKYHILICDVQNIIEKFDYEERQTKFISNAVRNYDYHGIKWYMPYWDKELLDFWRIVEIDKKFNRNIFKKFTEYKYGDLMRKAPIVDTSQKIKNNKITSLIIKTKNLLFNYYNHFINYYRYLSYFSYLKYSLTNLNTNYYYMFTLDYIKYVKKK